MTIDERFTFGKYCGKTPRELIREGKGLYLMYCLDSIPHFTLSPYNFESAVKKTYSKQLRAIKQKQIYARKNMSMR